MFNTEIGSVYNFSIIPYTVISIGVIYIIRKYGINMKKLVDNKLETELDNLKIEVEIIKSKIAELDENFDRILFTKI
jgi:hypothetical protein